MCDFVSWIKGPRGEVWFLTDADCKKLMRKYPNTTWLDVIGHDAICEAMPEAYGKECEVVLKVPPVIARAIKAGKMQKMMEKSTEIREIHYDAQGRIHSIKGFAVAYRHGHGEYYLHGKRYYNLGTLKNAAKHLREKAKSKN